MRNEFKKPIISKIMAQNKYNKEFEFLQWTQDKLKEYDLTKWRIACMTHQQFNLMTGKHNSSFINGSCISAWKMIWINQDFVYEFKLNTMKDIFLHELAHAVTGEGHTAKFRTFCKSIGCKSIRAFDNTYIFDMYGKYKVTPMQNHKCLMKYSKTHKSKNYEKNYD